MRQQFEDDLKRFYELLGERQRELGRDFSIFEREDVDKKIGGFIDDFLISIELSCIKENRVALLSRLIGLRDEQMVQALEKEGKDSIFITQAKEKAYLWVKDFYLKRHANLIAHIEEEWLLSPFYRRILRGVHMIGIAMSEWQSVWNEHIINTINPLLELEFDKNGEAIAKMLHENGLYDPDEKGNDGDRSYSVLEKVGKGYEAKAYAVAFPREVLHVKDALESLIDDLKELEDPDCMQKAVFVAYFEALRDAFCEEHRSALIRR